MPNEVALEAFDGLSSISWTRSGAGGFGPHRANPSYFVGVDAPFIKPKGPLYQAQRRRK
jgi:hypothetical protein